MRDQALRHSDMKLILTREQLEQFTLEQLSDGFSDCYKSIHNMRPRFRDQMTLVFTDHEISV